MRKSRSLHAQHLAAASPAPPATPVYGDSCDPLFSQTGIMYEAYLKLAQLKSALTISETHFLVKELTTYTQLPRLR